MLPYLEGSWKKKILEASVRMHFKFLTERAASFNFQIKIFILELVSEVSINSD